MERANANLDPREHFNFAAEVAALRTAVGNDPFILPLLAALPHEATSPEGLQSEAGLRARFRKVKRVCRQVALVPAHGGGLWVHGLSWLQSLLSFSPLSADSALGPSHAREVDTFEVLARADACLRRGQLERAVRLVGTLQGEPARAAADWLHEARLWLEMRQTALLLQLYLTATSVSLS